MQTASLMALAAFPNLALTWSDLDWLRGRTDLPLLVKGVLTAEDARLALEHGVDGIVVSNHGGRQVDGAVASLDALVEVRDEIGAGRDGADGRRHPPRRRRAQGAGARRRRASCSAASTRTGSRSAARPESRP